MRGSTLGQGVHECRVRQCGGQWRKQARVVVVHVYEYEEQWQTLLLHVETTSMGGQARVQAIQ